MPASISRATSRRYSRSTAVTDYREFADRGHSLTIDSRWEQVADAVLQWLSDQSLSDRLPRMRRSAEEESRAPAADDTR